jgi:hypothetical protein
MRQPSHDADVAAEIALGKKFTSVNKTPTLIALGTLVTAGEGWHKISLELLYFRTSFRLALRFLFDMMIPYSKLFTGSNLICSISIICVL